MALGGNRLRQHVVEFIRGTGVVTDGVVDATSLNGPWTWQVPDGVAELRFDGCAGGQSGTGGAAISGGITSVGGGAGGSPGGGVIDAKLVVIPGWIITVTLGSGGPAVAAGNRGISGGNTVVSGPGLPNFSAFSTQSIFLRGASAWQGNLPTASAGGSGLGSNGVAGNAGDTTGNEGTGLAPLGAVHQSGFDGGPIAHGGAGNPTGSVAGFNGALTAGFTSFWGRTLDIQANGARAVGTTDGTVSSGGGGSGTPSLFGFGGLGGSGGPGQNSPSYGAGGGGGAGGFGGGAGGDGYVRFTYWSVD